MQAMNRAIEDASDFIGFRDALMAKMDQKRQEVSALKSQKPAKRPDENRAQYRARLRAMGKVSA
jgi:hypothetical protein